MLTRSAVLAAINHELLLKKSGSILLRHGQDYRFSQQHHCNIPDAKSFRLDISARRFATRRESQQGRLVRCRWQGGFTLCASNYTL